MSAVVQIIGSSHYNESTVGSVLHFNDEQLSFFYEEVFDASKQNHYVWEGAK